MITLFYLKACQTNTSIIDVNIEKKEFPIGNFIENVHLFEIKGRKNNEEIGYISPHFWLPIRPDTTTNALIYAILSIAIDKVSGNQIEQVYQEMLRIKSRLLPFESKVGDDLILEQTQYNKD